MFGKHICSWRYHTHLKAGTDSALKTLCVHAGMDPATEEAMGGADAAPGTGWGDLGQASVVDGVRLIAGGIESVLQRLQIQVYAFQVRLTPDSLWTASCLAAAK